MVTAIYFTKKHKLDLQKSELSLVGCMSRFYQSLLIIKALFSESAQAANLPLFLLAIFNDTYVGTQRLSCNYTSAELTQFDGRARGDDVIGSLTGALVKLQSVS